PLNSTPVAQYEEGNFVDPRAPVHFEYLLYTQGNSGTKIPIASLDDFEMKVTLTVTQSHGFVQTIDLAQHDDGLWRSIEPLQVPRSGRYQWSLVATSPDGSQQSTIVHVAEQGSF